MFPGWSPSRQGSQSLGVVGHEKGREGMEDSGLRTNVGGREVTFVRGRVLEAQKRLE